MKAIKKIRMIVLLIGLILISNESFAKDSFLKPVVSISGFITSESNGKPIVTHIYILNSSGEKIGVCKTNDKDGSYFLTGLKPGTNYFLSFVSDKTEFKRIEIAAPPVKYYTEIYQDFFVKPLDGSIQSSKI